MDSLQVIADCCHSIVVVNGLEVSGDHFVGKFCQFDLCFRHVKLWVIKSDQHEQIVEMVWSGASIVRQIVTQRVYVIDSNRDRCWMMLAMYLKQEDMPLIVYMTRCLFGMADSKSRFLRVLVVLLVFGQYVVAER